MESSYGRPSFDTIKEMKNLGHQLLGTDILKELDLECCIGAFPALCELLHNYFMMKFCVDSWTVLSVDTWQACKRLAGLMMVQYSGLEIVL